MRKLFYLLTFILFSTQIIAQCPTCNPDVACVSADGQPTVCPLELPAATAGEYYEQVLTFYLPTSFVEPSLDVTVTLNQITISSVTGLPFGLSYSTNNANGIYYPSQGENYGCATLCGTPLLPGVYDVMINIAIIADVFGFEVTDNQSYTYTIVVEPGSGGNASFTYDAPAGCGEVTVSFNALIQGNSSQVTTYSWDFGNNTFSDESSPVVTYSEAGEFTASLQTTISDYVLTTVALANINGNGNGDVDEFFSSPADPFFVLTDAQGNAVYTSEVIDDVTTHTWSDLSIVLTNPPYTLTFWDDDSVTSDDLLSSFSIENTEGEIAFNSGDGTVGSFIINLNTTTDVTEEATVIVFPMPFVSISETTTTLTAEGTDIDSYQWLLNGEPVEGANEASINPTEGGTYSCIVSNVYGCTYASEEVLFCFQVSVIFDPVANELYVDDIYESYQWYFNGLPLENANDFYIVAPTPGNYALVVTTDYGCEIESSVITVVSSVEDISIEKEFLLYPQPADQELSYQSLLLIDQIEIYNTQGLLVKQLNKSTHSGTSRIDVSTLPNGVYVIRFVSAENSFSKTFLVEH